MNKKVLTVIFAVFVVFGWLNSVSAEKLVPKVDNFIFLLDSSGSMGWMHKLTGKSKLVVAKEMVAQLNTEIPDLEYKAALSTLAPLKVYQKPSPYVTTIYGQSIDAIPTDNVIWGFLGNPTPLGKGIAFMDTLLKDMSGSTALILVSDGCSNQGEEPVAAARALYAKYSPNLCIHVISLASTNTGQKVLDDIAALKSCSVQTTCDDLEDAANRSDFIQRVFYDVAQETTMPDSDHDGVLDIHDQCPDTPEGVLVDEMGCPLDTDGDGVYDYLDECPGTPAGVAVDAKGCPLEAAEALPLPGKVNLLLEFDLNKADIRPHDYEGLEKMANYLLSHPEATAVVQVEGHTDSLGTAAYNYELSRKRAQRVVNYLVQKFGVEPSVFTIQAYGKDRPVADNDTEQGRQKNRRVLVSIVERSDK